MRVAYKNGKKCYSLYELQQKAQKEEPVKFELFSKDDEATLVSADVRSASVGSVVSAKDNASAMSPPLSDEAHE